jgi:hypothetical protein
VEINGESFIPLDFGGFFRDFREIASNSSYQVEISLKLKTTKSSNDDKFF